MSDGRAVMGGEAKGLTRVQVEGPVDERVEVVWFEDAATAEIITVIVNFAAHPSMMYRMKQLGAEYPGSMREAVCRGLGRNIPIVFLQGACGNTIATTGATVGLEYRTFTNVDEAGILAVLRAGEHVDDKRAFYDKHFTSLTDKALVRAIALREDMRRRNLPPRSAATRPKARCTQPMPGTGSWRPPRRSSKLFSPPATHERRR